jgi:DNA adenine methylase
MTPFSREEYVSAINANGKRKQKKPDLTSTMKMARLLESESSVEARLTETPAEYSVEKNVIPPGSGNYVSNEDLERARLFFARARQSRTGLAQTASVGRWANCLYTSRAGMAGAVSRWLGSVPALEWVASRLLPVQIEHDDAFEVIRRYDGPDTLFYCDPPYPHASRGDSKAYGYEMTDQQHIDLHHRLCKVEGRVAISGYHGKLMDDLYRDWRVHEEGARQVHSVKQERMEVLWTNY